MPTSIDLRLLIGLFICISICQLTYAELPVDLSSQRQENAITFAIELQEGGRLTNKAVSLFESYMERQSCSVIVIEQPHRKPHRPFCIEIAYKPCLYGQQKKVYVVTIL